MTQNILLGADGKERYRWTSDGGEENAWSLIRRAVSSIGDTIDDDGRLSSGCRFVVSTIDHISSRWLEATQELAKKIGSS